MMSSTGWNSVLLNREETAIPAAVVGHPSPMAPTCTPVVTEHRNPAPSL